MCAVGLLPQFEHVLVPGSRDELLTAAAGRELGQQIRATLAEAPPGALVVLDLRGVLHAGYRALQEVLGAVATAHAEHAARYLLVRVERDDGEFQAALNAAAIERHAPLPVVVGMEPRIQILGRLTKSERDTLELVQRAGSITAGELRTQSHLATSAASNRLRRLYRLRLVCRYEHIIAESGGREFVYQPLALRTDVLAIPTSAHAP